MGEQEIGRARIFASDRIEYVIHGNEGGRECWRTYTATVTTGGQLFVKLDTLAYSPPNDWDELPFPEGRSL